MAAPNGTNGDYRHVGSASASPLPLNIFAALQSRAALSQRLGNIFEGRRNMHELLGYKPTLTYKDFKARYLRQHIARRIVAIWPELTWAYPPTIQEDNTSETQTPFEAACRTLVERFHLFSLLERTDVLASLGQYACVLLGLKGQSDLAVPATAVRSLDDLLYLTPYSEEFAQVTELEMDAGKPTFGQPLYYTFHFGRGSTLGQTGPAVPTIHGRVHASRVIHVVVDPLDDEVYGIPILEAVFDLLDDLYKTVGGIAEATWRDAVRRLVFALRDDARMSADDEKALATEVEEFINELRPFVRVSGMDVSTITGTIPSPKDVVEVIMGFIATTIRVPKRRFMGSEVGQLASTTDEANVLQGAQRRQVQVAEQRILRPLLDRLIDPLHVLPMPAKPYTLDWQNLLALSEEQQATIVKDYATALGQAFSAGDYSSVIAISRTLVESLGFDPEDPLLDPGRLLLPEPGNPLAPAPEEL